MPLTDNGTSYVVAASQPPFHQQWKAGLQRALNSLGVL
jgi:hypothetical protein